MQYETQTSTSTKETTMIRKDLFTSVLTALRFGSAQDELSEKLNECVQACQNTGKAAEITLKIKIKPEGDGQYFLEDDIKTKIPSLPKQKTLMFGTPEGNLQRNDPRQAEMDLKVVAEKQPEAFKAVG